MATSIISSELISDREQSNGSRYVRMRFVAEDHDSGQRDVFVGPKNVAADWNATTWMAGHEQAVLDGLAEEEEQDGLNMNDVENPLTYALNPKWSASKPIAKTMIYHMMEESDPRFVIYLEPLIDYLGDPLNFTPTQLANFLDITITELARMKRRANAILDDSDTVTFNLVDFDAEEGIFE